MLHRRTDLAVKHAGEALYGMSSVNHGALEWKCVFCSDMTFSATLNPVVYEGGIPVFVDTEKNSWNMSPMELEKALGLFEFIFSYPKNEQNTAKSGILCMQEVGVSAADGVNSFAICRAILSEESYKDEK